MHSKTPSRNMFSSSYSARCASWFAVKLLAPLDTVLVWYWRLPPAAGAGASSRGSLVSTRS